MLPVYRFERPIPNHEINYLDAELAGYGPELASSPIPFAAKLQDQEVLGTI